MSRRTRLLFLPLLAFAGIAHAAPRSGRDRAVDRLATRFMRDRCHVGLSIVAHAGGTDTFYNYGAVRRGTHARPTSSSVYEIASLTKTFTGMLASRALVEGRMTLDGDFRRFLSESYPNLERAGKPITLRTLASHTSGLPRDIPDTDDLMRDPDYGTLGAEIIARNSGLTRADAFAALHEVSLRAAPGDSFAYSNVGIRVIGYGLEKVYHHAFGTLLTRYILQPLGMIDTGMALSPSMRSRLVTPYGRNRRAQPYHDATAGAAYGLYSTPRDMAEYLRWQLAGRNAVTIRAHMLIRGSEADGQGLIWNIARDGGERILWHGGGSFGMTSQMVLYPGRSEGYVLLANDACPGTEDGLKRLAMKFHALAAAKMR